MTRPRLEGILDWFRKPKSGLPVPSKEQSNLPSIFDIFSTRAPAPVKPSIFSELEKKEVRLPKLFETFEKSEVIVPPPPAPAAAAERSTWEGMFQAQAPTEVASFEFAEPTPKPKKKTASGNEPTRYERGIVSPDDWPLPTRPLWMDTSWDMPSDLEVAEQVMSKIDRGSMESILSHVVSETQSPWWKEELRHTFQTHEPATIDITEIADYGDHQALVDFFGVPYEVLERYLKEHQYNPAAEAMFEAEVLMPLFRKFESAMDFIKAQEAESLGPEVADLHGWFTIIPNDGNGWSIVYQDYSGPQ